MNGMVSDFIISFPWPETGIAAAVGFIAGFLAGGRWGTSRGPRSRA